MIIARNVQGSGSGNIIVIELLDTRRLLSGDALNDFVDRAAHTRDVANIATFIDGNGWSAPDQYPGAVGDGWLSPWTRSAKVVKGTVLPGTDSAQPSPIDRTEPHFLQVRTAGAAAISRAFVGDGGSSDRVIQFDYRFDGTAHGKDSADYILIFGANAAAASVNSDALGTSATWAIKASMNARGAIWEFAGKNSDGSIDFAGGGKGGVAAAEGDVYQFTINEHFDDGKGSYTAIVRDTTSGAVYTTPTALAFCTNPTSTDHLDFGMSLGSGEIGKFSIDAIHVATKTGPTPVVFAIGGFGTPQNPEPGVLSVTQSVQHLLSYDGLDLSDVRGYEENYDTDKTVNPDGDSIAAEIDKIPLGTPVVLMGFSFGGGQAITTASQVKRPINDMLLFDPVVKTDYAHQVHNITDNPTQIVQTLPASVENAVDMGRVIFQSNGAIYPDGPYAFKITSTSNHFENLSFPRASGHVEGQCTPEKGIAGFGASGDPINDTAEFVENAIDGFPMFWDGIESGNS